MSPRLSARYDAAAPDWGRRIARLGFPEAYRMLVAEACARLPVPSGRLSALDLGAGDGALAEALRLVIGPRVQLSLVDLSPAMLRAAKARLGPDAAQLIAGDIDTPDLVPGRYDIVASAHLVEHLPDLRAALRRMADLLRPGGTVILCVSRPHWCSRLVWFLWRHRPYSQRDVLAALADAGFAHLHSWQPPAGPPRRLSLAYAARKPG